MYSNRQATEENRKISRKIPPKPYTIIKLQKEEWKLCMSTEFFPFFYFGTTSTFSPGKSTSCSAFNDFLTPFFVITFLSLNLVMSNHECVYRNENDELLTPLHMTSEKHTWMDKYNVDDFILFYLFFLLVRKWHEPIASWLNSSNQGIERW